MPVFQSLKIIWISKENPILNLIYKNLTLRPERLILGILKAITEIKSVTTHRKLKNHVFGSQHPQWSAIAETQPTLSLGQMWR